ncbi:S8 family serine peptidase [Novosphingobium sp. YJ-S2-02]|uniref:S8 family serine peptidase n=1 Tax=Novosphingobium aureum TaxID=2792964 RepID=A0A931HA66_9SPHN|nr:S8 family serine peptidase [Novosphingobium aureum]MBH0112067.1 S8 family serine peptidase [Novosphingobium aureum]
MAGSKWTRRALGAAVLLLAAAPLHAQLGAGLPVDPAGTLGSIGERVGEALDDARRSALDPFEGNVRQLRDLARERVRRLASFVSDNQGAVEWDDERQPAVRGEVLLLDPDAQALALAGARGYRVIEQGSIAGLDIPFARLAVPEGTDLDDALKRLRKALPGREISADQLHFPAGTTAPSGQAGASSAALPRGGTVGVIDGGLAAGSAARLVAQKGFARGAPRQDEHAAAIASLLTGAGTARLYAADVYGSDPAGGNALAIARALGWMHEGGVPVVSISLVGPPNPLLARAVAKVQQDGMVVVAAVGNDGAAAPPAYPASYPGVVAVTGVDGAGRVLIEAGRAGHLDYAAPGADMSALVPGKGRIDLRGTSFAAPLAAARIAARLKEAGAARAALGLVDGEALHPSRSTGRGVVCNICRSGL